MADDDNKIIIPIEVQTDDAQDTIDHFVDTLQNAFKEFGAQGPSGSTDNNKSNDPFKDSFDFGKQAPDSKKSGVTDTGSNDLVEPASKLSEAADKLSAAADDLNKATDPEKNPSSSSNKSNDPFKDSFNFDSKNKAHVTDTSKYPAPTAADTPEAATAASVQRAIDNAAKRTQSTSEEFKGRHDALRDPSNNDGNTVRQTLRDFLSSFGFGAGATAASGGGGGGGGKPPVPPAPPEPHSGGGGEGGLNAGRESLEKLRESLHVLRPVLDEAGLGMGKLGEFARLAGAGFTALGVAAAGTLAVSLVKMRDEIDATKRSLDLMLGGSGSGAGGAPGAAGSSLFDSFKRQADDLGTSLNKILPLIEGLQDLRSKQQASFDGGAGFDEKTNNFVPSPSLGRDNQALTQDQIAAITKAVTEAARVDRTAPEVASKQIEALLKSATSGNGLLKPEALDPANLSRSLGLAITDALRNSGFIPGNIRNTAQLQQGIESGRVQVRGGDIAPALARAEPALASKSAEIPATFTEVVGKFSAKLEELGVTIGDTIVTISKWLNKSPSDAIKEVTGKAVEFNQPDYAKEAAGRGVDASASGRGALESLGRGEHNVIDPLLKAVDPRPALNAATDALRPPEGQDNILSNLGKLLHGDFSNANKPPDVAKPADTTTGPRTEAAQPNQQVAGLLQEIVSAIAGATRNKDTTIDTPAATLGARGEAQPEAPQATTQLAALAAAASQATQKLLEVPAPQQAAAEIPTAEPVAAAEGGHIRGAGTSTSDSIDAKLSDGEYVLRAAAVEKIGVDKLDKVNVDGDVSHFADGGSVDKEKSKKDQLDALRNQIAGIEDQRQKAEQQSQAEMDKLNAPDNVTVTPGTERPKSSIKSVFNTADITGFGDSVDPRKASDDAATNTWEQQNTSVVDNDADKTLKRQEYTEKSQRIKLKIEDQNDELDKRESALEEQFKKLQQSHSTGGLIHMFSHGGLVGNAPLRAPSLQHFNTGGLAARVAQTTSAPPVRLADGGAAASAPSPSQMEQWGKIDLTTNHGTVQVATERETMRHLSSLAGSAKRYSTGPKPNFYGGGR